MTREEIVTKVNGFLSEEFEVDVENLDATGNLQEVLDLDSLDYVDLVVIIESNFGFKLTGEDFKEIVSLNDFYDLLVNKYENA